MLRINCLRGFNAGSPSTNLISAPSVSWSTYLTDLTTRPSTAGTYTFTATTVGTAATGRVIVVSAWAKDATSIASATINSSAATIITNGNAAGAGNAMGIFHMALPTSETAVDISVTWAPIGAAAIQKSAISVWLLNNLASSVASTFGISTVAGTSAPSIVLNAPLNGVGVAAGYTNAAALSTWSSPFVIDFDTTANFLGITSNEISGASLHGSTAATTVAASYVNASSVVNMVTAAIWV